MNKVILMVVLLMTSLAGLMAQEAPASRDSAETRRAGPSGRRATPQNEPRFDISFPGGPLEALFKAVSQASGEPLNLIVSGDTSEVTLPAFTLTHVTVDDLMNALQHASLRLEIRENEKAEERLRNVGLRLIRQGNIWTLLVEKSVPPESPRLIQFHNLEHYLGKYQLKDITTAIQTGWKMIDPRHPIDLAFHEETKLLVVAGTTRQIELVESVLNELAPHPAEVAQLINSGAARQQFITALKHERISRESELAGLRKTYGEKHPKIIEKQAQTCCMGMSQGPRKCCRSP